MLNHSLNCEFLGEDKYLYVCELCKSEIYFTLNSRKGLRKCSEIKHQIDQEKNKFICFLVAIVIFTGVISAILGVTVDSIV